MSASQSNTKTLQKRLITQRLHTDLGRSVGVTKVIQLLYLTEDLRPNLPTTHNSCAVKRKNL